MKVALAQITASQDKAENLEAIRRAAGEAAAAGARLLLCPELAMYNPAADVESFADIAEPLDGEFVQALSALARQHQLALVVGVYEPSPDPKRVYNVEVAIGPDGDILAVYRKLHLFDALGWKESDKVLPGEVTEENLGVVFDVGGWRFGIVTCFDLRFPELVRTLADAGAEVILHPTAWTSGPVKEDHHAIFCHARAVENTCYVLSANQSPPVFTGRSLAVDPMGVAIAGLHEDDGLVVVTLDKDRLTAVRERLPLLSLRRLGARA
ncbi:carbon-nitrogen hydrolase family protein [Nonomuraea sp. NPDC046802]|uniref:carbon-nitrogen hydrolase family protein n=1 Tax=Nonomuraea sp. NPDC046802 TaxID=3154919 RepID=UPI00340397E7